MPGVLFSSSRQLVFFLQLTRAVLPCSNFLPIHPVLTIKPRWQAGLDQTNPTTTHQLFLTRSRANERPGICALWPHLNNKHSIRHSFDSSPSHPSPTSRGRPELVRGRSLDPQPITFDPILINLTGINPTQPSISNNDNKHPTSHRNTCNYG